MVQIIIFLSFQGYYQILSDIIRFLWYHRSPQGIRSLWSHSLSETSWNVTGDRLSLGIRGCQDRIGWHGPSWVLTRSYGVPHKSMNNLLLSVGKPMVWGTQLGLGKLRQFFFWCFLSKKDRQETLESATASFFRQILASSQGFVQQWGTPKLYWLVIMFRNQSCNKWQENFVIFGLDNKHIILLVSFPIIWYYIPIDLRCLVLYPP